MTPLYNELLGSPLLSREEEKQLYLTIINATSEEEKEKAKSEFVHRNLRLCYKIAKEYSNYGMDLEDLISEANCGLVKAVDRWDPAKGARFSSYASFWIKQYVRRALSNQSRVIRLPVQKTYDLPKINLAKEQFEAKNGREPTLIEISKITKIPPKRIRTIQESVTSAPISLDSPFFSKESTQDHLRGENPSTIGESIPDDHADDPLGSVISEDTKDVLRKVLKQLNRREQGIIRQRFGLNSDGEKTLEEVGRNFDITRERVRQIQEKALKKLKYELSKMKIDNILLIS